MVLLKYSEQEHEQQEIIIRRRRNPRELAHKSKLLTNELVV